MQIGSKFTIGVHIITALDYFKNIVRVNSDFLAGSIGVNPVIVRTVVSQLREAGIVRTQQGSSGAELIKQLDEITLFDVYKAVGSVDSEKGLFHFHEQPNPECPVGRNIHKVLDLHLADAQRAMEERLKSTTLAEILKDTKQAIEKEQEKEHKSIKMKKILIVNASKRKKGNSYALENKITADLEGKAEVSTFNIGERDVRVCLACDGCKRQHTPNCIQKDDFTALIPEIDACDAMLILAPVHWDQFPAQLKAFLDRTYSFMDFTQPDFSMAGRKDKKLAGYFFAGFGPVDVYTQMVETNLKSFATAGFRDYKAHVAGDANVPGSIMEKPNDLAAADEIVKWLLA